MCVRNVLHPYKMEMILKRFEIIQHKYMLTINFVLLAHVLLSNCLILYSNSLVAHYYSSSLSFLSHLEDFG